MSIHHANTRVSTRVSTRVNTRVSTHAKRTISVHMSMHISIHLSIRAIHPRVRPGSKTRAQCSSGTLLQASRHRRRHVHRAGMGVPVLKMTASEVGDAEMPITVCRDSESDLPSIRCHLPSTLWVEHRAPAVRRLASDSAR